MGVWSDWTDDGRDAGRIVSSEREDAATDDLSQDKDPDTQQRVIEALRAPGTYHNPRLAEEMSRALSDG